MTDIVIVNKSKIVTEADLIAALPAWQIQIDRDVVPVWGNVGAKLWLEDQPFPFETAWRCYLQDGLDQPGDLGYHEDNGIPDMKIDVAGSTAYGDDWRSVVSHELVETIVDPLTNRMSPDGRWAVEACDPVETTFYMIGNVPVSNFVTPSYFGFDRGTKYDFNGQLIAPCPEMLPGGYQMELQGQRWISHTAFKVDGSRSWMSLRPTGRSAWRASP